MEHQRTLKDFEKVSTEMNQVREQKDKLTQELQVGLCTGVVCLVWCVRIFCVYKVGSQDPRL